MKSVAHQYPAVVWLQGSWSERQCSAELCFHCRQPCWWQTVVAGERNGGKGVHVGFDYCSVSCLMTGHSEPLLQHRGVGCPLARQEETENGLWLQCITINTSCSFTSRSSILPKSCFKRWVICSKWFSGFALYKIWVVHVHAQLATTVLELERYVSNLKSGQVYIWTSYMAKFWMGNVVK